MADVPAIANNLPANPPQATKNVFAKVWQAVKAFFQSIIYYLTSCCRPTASEPAVAQPVNPQNHDRENLQLALAASRQAFQNDPRVVASMASAAANSQLLTEGDPSVILTQIENAALPAFTTLAENGLLRLLPNAPHFDTRESARRIEIQCQQLTMQFTDQLVRLTNTTIQDVLASTASADALFDFVVKARSVVSSYTTLIEKQLASDDAIETKSSRKTIKADTLKRLQTLSLSQNFQDQLNKLEQLAYFWHSLKQLETPQLGFSGALAMLQFAQIHASNIEEVPESLRIKLAPHYMCLERFTNFPLTYGSNAAKQVEDLFNNCCNVVAQKLQSPPFTLQSDMDTSRDAEMAAALAAADVLEGPAALGP